MKKILKYIIGIKLVIIMLLTIYFQHQVTYDAQEVKFFGIGNKIDLDKENLFTKYYVKYFFLKDVNPKYIWKNDAISKYNDYCYEKGKNCLIFPHQQIFADMQWLGSIQYIGALLSPERAKYIYPLLDNITNLNPFWDYPYVFGQLILPINKVGRLYSEVSEDEKLQSWKNTINFGEKGIKYNCDKEKAKKILSLSTSDFYEIVHGKGQKYDELNNVCDNVEIPNYLGFNYFYYMNDGEKAAMNYKLASFDDNSVGSSPGMVAIVTGRQGQYQKSMHLWYSHAINLYEQLSKMNQDDTKFELIKEKYHDALKKAVGQFQFQMLDYSEKKLQQKPECMRDYECILNSGTLIDTLSQVVLKCQKMNITENEFDILDYSKLSENEEEFNDKLNCIILSYGIQIGLINPQNGEFTYPLETDENHFKYVWDEEIQARNGKFQGRKN